LLDDAWDAAPAGANTLREQLRANEVTAGQILAAGSLASVSKNSASQAWALSGPGAFTPAELVRAWRDLLNLFDSISDLMTRGAETVTDEAIYAEMKSQLRLSANSVSLDLRNLRAT
jgi:hypothetical protein